MLLFFCFFSQYALHVWHHPLFIRSWVASVKLFFPHLWQKIALSASIFLDYKYCTLQTTCTRRWSTSYQQLLQATKGLQFFFWVGVVCRGTSSQNVGHSTRPETQGVCVCCVCVGGCILWSTLLSVHLSLHAPNHPHSHDPPFHLTLKDYCGALV